MILPDDLVIMACTPLEQGGSLLLIGGVENEVQRRLEPAGDFMLVRLQREIGGHDAEYGRDDEARDRAILLDGADELDDGGIQKDFLIGFAERGLHGVLARIDPTSRKGDLTRVSAQMLAADGEDQARLRTIGSGDEHSGGSVRLRALVGAIAFERAINGRCGKRLTKAIRKAQFVGSSEKKCPSLHMPCGLVASASAMSASS